MKRKSAKQPKTAATETHETDSFDGLKAGLEWASGGRLMVSQGFDNARIANGNEFRRRKAFQVGPHAHAADAQDRGDGPEQRGIQKGPRIAIGALERGQDIEANINEEECEIPAGDELEALVIAEANDSFFLAQRYAENTGFDIKLYVTGKEVYAVAKKSPLQSEITEGLIPVTPQLRKLALDVGKLFGLDIFGLDVVETPNGLMIVDINDFPSFGRVPRAVARVSEYVLHAAKRAEMERTARLRRSLRRRTATIEKRAQLASSAMQSAI